MYKYKCITLGFIALLSLTACSTRAIVSRNDGLKFAGTMKVGLQAHEAEASFNGKVYRGSWISDYPGRELMAQRSGPKKPHSNRIFINLKDEDGGEMVCIGYVLGLENDLTCTVEGKEFLVALR